MLLKSLAVATGLALTATHAFVIVPEIAQADKEIITTLPIDTQVQAQSQSVKLSCPGCPVQLKHHHGGYQVKENIPNHLELTFSIDSESDVDRLLVNNFELYPEAGSWYSPLRAPQILDFTEMAMKHPRKSKPNTPQLGYSLAIRPVMKEEQGQQLELIDISLQIIEVGNSFVDGIPNINVKLIKTPAGKLMIGNIEVTESKWFADAPTETPEDCTTLYCKWRAAVKKMQGGKHCGDRMGHGHHAHGKVEGHRIKHHHTWGQLFKNITSHILLPVLIGLVAGVSVSIIFMIVGTFVICLWRVLVRRQPPFARRHCRRRGHSCHKAAKSEAAVVEEEKAALVDYEDAPLPMYSDKEESEDKPVQL